MFIPAGIPRLVFLLHGVLVASAFVLGHGLAALTWMEGRVDPYLEAGGVRGGLLWLWTQSGELGGVGTGLLLAVILAAVSIAIVAGARLSGRNQDAGFALEGLFLASFGAMACALLNAPFGWMRLPALCFLALAALFLLFLLRPEQAEKPWSTPTALALMVLSAFLFRIAVIQEQAGFESL